MGRSSFVKKAGGRNMSITLNVPQYSVTEDTVYWNDLFEEHKNLPM